MFGEGFSAYSISEVNYLSGDSENNDIPCSRYFTDYTEKAKMALDLAWAVL
jgi:hypothetical protein